MLCVAKSYRFVLLAADIELNAIRRDAHQLFELLQLGLGEAREHPIGKLHIGMRLLADADPQTGKVISSSMKSTP